MSHDGKFSRTYITCLTRDRCIPMQMTRRMFDCEILRKGASWDYVCAYPQPINQEARVFTRILFILYTTRFRGVEKYKHLPFLSMQLNRSYCMLTLTWLQQLSSSITVMLGWSLKFGLQVCWLHTLQRGGTSPLKSPVDNISMYKHGHSITPGGLTSGGLANLIFKLNSKGRNLMMGLSTFRHNTLYAPDLCLF